MERPVVVVGGGIIGLAIAYTLRRERPDTPLVLFEKERAVATHQTGHNSGVIHSGVYYRPGSLKAELCVRGRSRLLEFLEEHGIAHRICGKLIVATRPEEVARLDELERRARANGIPGLRRIGRAEIRAIEPEVAGSDGLHVPGTGIVDYREVSLALEREILRMGGTVRSGVRVLSCRKTVDGIDVETTEGHVAARFLVNAAGLYSDRVARSAGVSPPGLIVPFRGEYYLLRPESGGLVRGLVYPVPDPEMPFLGVHPTPTIHGSIEAGPNAILAFAREGYRKRDLRPAELAQTLAYRGFYRMARRFWRTSIHEVHRSLSRAAFLEDLRRLVPALRDEDLTTGGAGVRAQALRPTGELVDDFLLEERPEGLHVLNAPSPGATSSLAIAEYLVRRLPPWAA